jgi:hypothetical protein
VSMEKEKLRYEIIKSMVKTTHNDYELGQKVRNFFREEEQLDGEIDLKKYIKLIEGELVMSNYNDGWLTEWYKKKLKEIKDRIKKRKDD